VLSAINGVLFKTLNYGWIVLINVAKTIVRSGDLRFILTKLLMPHLIVRGLDSSSLNGSALDLRLLMECKSKIVLEFGSGGSTLLLAASARRIVSIESDKKFAKIMNGEIEKRNLQTKATVLYANIGPTKSYGQPIIFLQSIYKYKYKNYIETYFRLNKGELQPQVVFIDGRFRVWCAVECCKRLKHNFTLIIDDYFNRPEYHIIENLIGSALPFSGNTALFRVKIDQLDLAGLNMDTKYKLDFR
jgi:hypothetical protein